jgi:hypothetical protein
MLYAFHDNKIDREPLETVKFLLLSWKSSPSINAMAIS